MVSLQKGQTVSLAKPGAPTLSKVVMGLGWDARKPKKAFGLFGGAAPEIDLDASCLMFAAGGKLLDTVYFGQLRSKDGSILHTGGAELARYDLSGSGSHTGQVMAKLVRSGGSWSFTALGEKTRGRTFVDMMPAITPQL